MDQAYVQSILTGNNGIDNVAKNVCAFVILMLAKIRTKVFKVGI